MAHVDNCPNLNAHLLTLQDQLDAIRDHLKDGASVIYFHHQARRWLFFLASDKEMYQGELKNLRKQLRAGKIKEIIPGEGLEIDGKMLFPMLVKMEEECHAWFMLRQEGLFGDQDWTPYLFTTAANRDHALAWLTKWSENQYDT